MPVNLRTGLVRKTEDAPNLQIQGPAHQVLHSFFDDFSFIFEPNAFKVYNIINWFAFDWKHATLSNLTFFLPESQGLVWPKMFYSLHECPLSAFSFKALWKTAFRFLKHCYQWVLTLSFTIIQVKKFNGKASDEWEGLTPAKIKVSTWTRAAIFAFHELFVSVLSSARRLKASFTNTFLP